MVQRKRGRTMLIQRDDATEGSGIKMGGSRKRDILSEIRGEGTREYS